MTAFTSKQWLLSILLLFMLAGCTTSLIYNRLDFLITWYVDDYVDLSQLQKTALKQQLAPALNWHRQEELKNYIALLNSIENNVAAPVSVDTVEAWTSEMIRAYRRAQFSLVEVALGFGESLSEEQMQEFAVSLREKQAELREKYLSRSDEEFIEISYERMHDNASDYLGRLSAEQKATFQQAAASLQRLDMAWLNDREDWLNRLEPYLKRQGDWQEQIRTLYKNRESYRSAEYQRVFAYNMAIVNQAITDVLNQRSDRQQQTLLTELGDFKEELQTLMAYRKSGPTAQRRIVL